MQTPTTEPNGGPSRRPPSTGPVAATWVAGTGAFLLLAAAAVFIAVSWDRLPEVAKLALVGAITGACIAGGRALRRTLPATGDVLFHLGAFLIPIDVAGLGLRASIGWRAIVVSEGVVGVGVLGALAGASGSVVLAWAATASMVVLAVGIAAVSPIPAVVTLAAAALAAHLFRQRRAAVAWSAVAALGPVLGFAVATALSGTGLGAGVLADLGADGGWLALAGCLLAAVVLGREAQAGHDLALAGLAVAGAVSGLATTWAHAGISGHTTVLSLPAAFLVIEAIALLCERDVFWRHPARGAAGVAEVVAVVVGAAWTAALVVAAPIVETGLDLFTDDLPWRPMPAAGASLAALALAWAVAGLRRRPTAPTLAGALQAVAAPGTGVWCALAAVAAIEVGTASAPATAVALVAVAAALLWSRSALSNAAGAVLAVWAPVALIDTPLLALAGGAAAAAAIAWAAAAATGSTPRARILGVAAVAGAAIGTALSVNTGVDPAALSAAGLAPGLATCLFVVQAWLLAAVLDRADRFAGLTARLAMLGAAGIAIGLAPSDGVTATAVATVLLVADWLRLRDRHVGFTAAAAAQVLVVVLARLAELDVPQTGLALVMAALVWGGLAAVVDDEWREPLLAAAAMGIGAGLFLASGDRRMLSDALVVSGGMVAAAGLMTGNGPLGHCGGAAATLGIIGHLSEAGVTALEPFVAPVAAHLLVAGWQGRRSRDLSSWTAYAPAIALLGGAALAERLDGGPAWHAVVAGAVGVAAVAVGGWRRLAAPLFLGTGLLVAVTGVECLGALAGVPTWGWLALGGSVLLGVGVALERADATPAEAGRRLVDVISERFA